MAGRSLDDMTLSAFFETVSLLLGAGIQTDEAVALVADAADGELAEVYEGMYADLVGGATLARAMARTKAFPVYAVTMVAMGAASGHLENTLASLARRYGDDARLFERVSQSVGYPAALLCVMTVVMAFTVFAVLPVFTDVYDNLVGGLTAGSYTQVSAALVVGWAAFAVTAVAALASLYVAWLARRPRGRRRLTAILERFPATREAMYGLSFSRMVSSLATSLAAGINVDDAMADAVAAVDHPVLARRAEKAHDLMTDPRNPLGMVDAMAKAGLLDPLYARLLSTSALVGGLDGALESLSETLATESLDSLSEAIDGVEPLLSAFLALAVGATLAAVMLPLVGIMGALA